MLTLKEEMTIKAEKLVADKRIKEKEALEKKEADYKAHIEGMTTFVKINILPVKLAEGERSYQIGHFSMFSHKCDYPNLAPGFDTGVVGRTAYMKWHNVAADLKLQEIVKDHMTGAFKDVYDFWIAEGFYPVIDYWTDNADEGFDLTLNW